MTGDRDCLICDYSVLFGVEHWTWGHQNSLSQNESGNLKALEGSLGHYLPHPHIWADYHNLYRSDDMHLSDRGMDIYLDD